MYVIIVTVTRSLQLYLSKMDMVKDTNMTCGDCDFFVFGIRSKPSETLLGNMLMNGYTIVFDRQHMRLGFAVTTCDLRDNQTGLHDLPMITDPEPRGDIM